MLCSLCPLWPYPLSRQKRFKADFRCSPILIGKSFVLQSLVQIVVTTILYMFLRSPTYFTKTLYLSKVHITFFGITSLSQWKLKTMCRSFCSKSAPSLFLLRKWLPWLVFEHETKLARRDPRYFSQTMLDNSLHNFIV